MILGDSLAQVAKDTTILKEVIVNVADTVTNYVYIKEVPVNKDHDLELLISLMGASSTIIALYFAIFKEEIIEILRPIRLKINNNNSIGELSKKTFGKKDFNAIYYHLEIENLSRNRLVEKVKVNLKGFSKKINSKTDIIKYPGEALFHLTPFEINGIMNSFTKRQVFDFGCVVETPINNYFLPSIVRSYGSYNQCVHKNEQVIYNIEILADNFHKTYETFYQVSFDGIFNNDPKEMRKHLQITKVNAIDDFRKPIKYEDN